MPREFASVSIASAPAVPAPGDDPASGATAAVLAATVALAFKGVVAKLAYATGMSVAAFLVLRFAVAVPLFWLGARWLVRGGLGLTRAQWIKSSATGFAFFLAAYTDLTAISLIEAGTSRLILFTFPVIVILLNAVLERRPPGLRDVLTFAVTYAGVAMVALPKGFSALSPTQIEGMCWAVASAVTYAIYLTASQPVMKEIGSARFTASSNTITLAAMLVAVGITPGFSELTYPAEGVTWGVVNAIACTVIPFFLLFEGIRRCGAVRASLLTLSGPVVTAIAAWAILGETLSPLQIGGFAVTIAGVASLSLPKSLFSRLFSRKTAA